MQSYCFFLTYANNSELFCVFTPNFSKLLLRSFGNNGSGKEKLNCCPLLTLLCLTTKLCAILLPKIVAFGNLANFYLGTWQNFEGLQAAAIFSKTVPSGFAGVHKFRIAHNTVALPIPNAGKKSTYQILGKSRSIFAKSAKNRHFF